MAIIERRDDHTLRVRGNHSFSRVSGGNDCFTIDGKSYYFDYRVLNSAPHKRTIMLDNDKLMVSVNYQYNAIYEVSPDTPSICSLTKIKGWRKRAYRDMTGKPTLNTVYTDLTDEEKDEVIEKEKIPQDFNWLQLLIESNLKTEE